VAKGDYPAELDIPLPFSLVSQDVSKNHLVVMPAYWFLYNMYALARNEWKYINRDKRPDKIQKLEFAYLAPDTIQEILQAIKLLESYAGKSFAHASGKQVLTEEKYRQLGKQWLLNPQQLHPALEVVATGMENTKRKTIIAKAHEADAIYIKMIRYYCVVQIMDWCSSNGIKNRKKLLENIPTRLTIIDWINLGGQLIPLQDVSKAIQRITGGKIKSWDDVHHWYEDEGNSYAQKKVLQAFAVLKETEGIHPSKIETQRWMELLNETLETRRWLYHQTYQSRAKDYENPFRAMVYDSKEEMENIMGKLEENEFLIEEKIAMEKFEITWQQWKKNSAK
jgi:hypothetical protein